MDVDAAPGRTDDGAVRATAVENEMLIAAVDAARNADLASTAPAWVGRLPAFDGEVLLDDDARWIAGTDFGKVRHREPAVVLRPAGADDVVRAVQFCRAEHVPIAPRGCAHSAGGQMMAPAGIVLDMRSMDRVLAVTAEHCDVEAGAEWRAVLVAAVEQGLTPPVVTDWLGVTVGGTLSMGGFGFMSFHRGSQMDHVVELEVVTGTGELVVCSRTQQPELFDAMFGTHGVFGIVVRARVELEPAPPSVRMVQACYGSLGAMWADFRGFSEGGRADLVHAFAAERSAASICTKMNSTEQMALDPADVERALAAVDGRWVFNLELVDLQRDGASLTPFDTTALGCEPGLVDVWEMTWKDFCFRLPPLILEEELKGQAPHPELCAWLPTDDRGLGLLEAEYARMDPAADHGNGPNLFFPLRPSLIGASCFPLPEDAEFVAFWGLLRRAEPASTERIAALVADNEVIYQRVLDVGGVRYLPDTHPETPQFWERHFGHRWPRIVELKHRYDPDGVLASSFGPVAAAS